MRELQARDMMLFQDINGRILHSDDLDELSIWEIEEYGIVVYDENTM
jgi:hypothetical protein